MKRRQNKKKVNMKTRILLATIGAAVLAAITSNVSASDALLTPRAAGNQIKVAPGVTAAQPAFTAQVVSPRALGNQTKTAADADSGTAPATICVKMMTGSPKTIQACADHPATMPGCNVVTTASAR